MEVLLYTILTLCALGVLSAVILYFVAQKFRVEEDPRIDEVEKMLPGANCGGCGFAGCRGMADALVKQDDISALFCPVGGGDCMKAVAAYLGKSAPEKEPQVATVRCGGTCDKRPRTNEYNGAKSCAVASSLYGLRGLREGVSQNDYRTAQEVAEESGGVCVVRVEGQGRRGDEGLQGGLHRMRQMPEGLCVRCHHH